ncbi:trans-sulfuration enzyme family protein [Aspergillus novofumigatus IBT 16806]|uniref:cystathionine gamma-lyase n=1 Tax=Aspergillus novofumigatus (strain IBT 16806) TaxID=1392255 RepID=A0A2I1C0S8_ASPN1|nr:cystathionine gamma-lyase [Aspergillus novofumigatus IBT 16806]PKX91244.1 cystathionine gamma-lyase [Aspergillus novofumigatus IBT 16806]
MKSFGTRAVRSGLPHDTNTGALVEPICLTATFAQQDIASSTGPYVYSRSGNPNRESFERAVADVESANHALAFSAGASSELSHRVHGKPLRRTHRYLTQLAPAFRVKVSFVDDIHTELAPLIDESDNKIRIVWIETLPLVNIQAVADMSHATGALVVVDNTFLSPYIQNPLKHEADIVLHSVTKYMNGHSTVPRSSLRYRSFRMQQEVCPVLLTLGLPTAGSTALHFRAPRASHTSWELANALEASSDVLTVNYPDLANHPQRRIAIQQHRNGLGGGMISFQIRGGSKAAATFCEATQLFTFAESLGGLESLCEIPAEMTHKGVPKDVREKGGIYDDLIRLSVGVEDMDDLKRDLLEALQKAIHE